jgi:hypothetical protein
VGTKEREEAETSIQKFSDAIKDTIDKESELSRREFSLQQQLRLATIKESKDAADKLKKIQDDAQKKAKESLEKYLEDRKKLIEQFSKDFAALKVFSLPNVGDPKANDELADRLNKVFQKLIDKTLPEINIKIKLDEKSVKEFSTQLSKLKAPNEPTIKNETDQSVFKGSVDFRKQGERIGEKFGEGFKDVFGKMFQEAFEEAIKNGLSGQQLEEFKAQLLATTTLATQGIKGVADAFGDFTDALLQGKNGMQAFGETLKNSFRAIAREIIKDIVLAGILSALSGGAANGGLSFVQAFGSLIGGSHKDGLFSVPRDGYIAELHAGEMVVPKYLSEQLRNLKLITPSFNKLNISSPASAGALVGVQRTTDVKSPLKNLQNALAGTAINTTTVIPDVRIRGNDLVLVFNRASQSQFRNFGR